jgi:hypothetical protein
MIKRFADIAAGTGQDAGAMMEEYAQARLNPIMRGRVLQRLMREGVVSEADLRRAGVDPRLMRREGGLDRLGMGSLDKIFNDLATKNMGKSAELANQLGKNFKNFWESLTKVREAIGGVIEKTMHLNGILKAGTATFQLVSSFIERMPQSWKNWAVGIGTVLAVAGPAVLVMAGLSKAVLGLSKAFTFFSLNPIVVEIGLIIAGLVSVLLLMRAIGIWHKSTKEADAAISRGNESIDKSRYRIFKAEQEKKGSGNTSEVAPGTYAAWGMRQPSTFMWPSGNTSNATHVIVHSAPVLNVSPGTTTEQTQSLQTILKQHAEDLTKHIVRQVHNAKRS